MHFIEWRLTISSSKQVITLHFLQIWEPDQTGIVSRWNSRFKCLKPVIMFVVSRNFHDLLHEFVSFFKNLRASLFQRCLSALLFRNILLFRGNGNFFEKHATCVLALTGVSYLHNGKFRFIFRQIPSFKQKVNAIVF